MRIYYSLRPTGSAGEGLQQLVENSDEGISWIVQQIQKQSKGEYCTIFTSLSDRLEATPREPLLQQPYKKGEVTFLMHNMRDKCLFRMHVFDAEDGASMHNALRWAFAQDFSVAVYIVPE